MFVGRSSCWSYPSARLARSALSPSWTGLETIAERDKSIGPAVDHHEVSSIEKMKRNRGRVARASVASPVGVSSSCLLRVPSCLLLPATTVDQNGYIPTILAMARLATVPADVFFPRAENIVETRWRPKRARDALDRARSNTQVIPRTSEVARCVVASSASNQGSVVFRPQRLMG